MHSQLEIDDGNEMEGSTLALRLRRAVESDPRFKGLFSEDRKDFPTGFAAFGEDMVIRVVQGLKKDKW